MQPSSWSQRGKRRAARALGVRRGVGDEVVEQHPERREADRAAQVGGQHQDHDDGGDGELGAVRHPEPRVYGVQPAGQVALARHRQPGPPEPGDQREQRTGRRQGRTDPHDADHPRLGPAARTASATGAAGGRGHRPGPEHRQHGDRHDGVHDDGPGQRQHDGARDHPLRLAHLLAERGDPGIAGEREEQQPRGLQHAVEPVVGRGPAGQVRRRATGEAGDRRRRPGPRAPARRGPGSAARSGSRRRS